MAPPLRRTGIAVLGQVPWGAHVCLFYETKQDLLDAHIAYFAAGLQDHEFCLWAISDPITEQEARDALAQGVPDFKRHLAEGRIEFLSGREWYLKGEEFDMQRVTGGWHAKLREAELHGFTGLRVSGNAFWSDTKYWKGFLSYEQELERSMAGRAMTALCTYRLAASPASDVLDVARAHQFTVARRHRHWEGVEVWREDDHTASAWRKKFESLTAREKEVMERVVAGRRNKQIAADLGVSEITVKVHRGNLMRKMEARSLAELMRMADSLRLSRAMLRPV